MIFFANVLRDNIGSKTNSASEKKLGMFFSWLIFNKFLKKLEHKEFSQANHLRELCGFQSQLTSARLGNQSNYHQFNSCLLATLVVLSKRAIHKFDLQGPPLMWFLTTRFSLMTYVSALFQIRNFQNTTGKIKTLYK